MFSNWSGVLFCCEPVIACELIVGEACVQNLQGVQSLQYVQLYGDWKGEESQVKLMSCFADYE